MTDSEDPPRPGPWLARLARWVDRRRWAILAGFAVVTAVSLVAGAGLMDHLGTAGLEAPASDSARGARIIQHRFGRRADVLALYRLPSGLAPAAGVRDPAVQAAVRRALGRAEADPAVATVVGGHDVPGGHGLSRDGRSVFAILSLRQDEEHRTLAVVERLRGLLTARLPSTPGPPTAVLVPLLGGKVPGEHALIEGARQSLRTGERYGLPIAGLLLLLIFRSVIAALLPLLVGAVSIVLALGLLELVSHLVTVNVFAVNVVTLLGLGVAIDYALFIVSRLREELARHGAEQSGGRADLRLTALVVTLSTAGRAVVFSGVTVAASLSALLVFPLPFLRSVAIGGLLVTLMAAGLAVTLLPALLAVLGRQLERGRILPGARRPLAGDPDGTARERHRGRRLWYRLAHTVMRHPFRVAVPVTAGLLLMAVPFHRLQPGTADLRSLPADVEARRVGELLERDFAASELAPHEVVAILPGPVLEASGQATLRALERGLEQLPGIRRVDSALALLDRLPAGALPERRRAALLRPWADGRNALLRVIGSGVPGEPAADREVDALRQMPAPEGTVLLVSGRSASAVDFVRSLRERVPLMLAIMAGAMFVVLYAAFRSVVLPFKAMAMNALSLTASFGAVVFVFQDGRMEQLLGYRSTGTIDATLPVIMFAVLFGLSMDYEVLILGRIREAYLQSRNTSLAVAEGLAGSGRLVTAAALLMVALFGSFAAAPVLFIKSLGLGMALAVALDATVVRALLVPATMVLLGDWNWWTPRWPLWRRQARPEG